MIQDSSKKHSETATVKNRIIRWRKSQCRWKIKLSLRVWSTQKNTETSWLKNHGSTPKISSNFTHEHKIEIPQGWKKINLNSLSLVVPNTPISKDRREDSQFETSGWRKSLVWLWMPATERRERLSRKKTVNNRGKKRTEEDLAPHRIKQTIWRRSEASKSRLPVSLSFACRLSIKVQAVFTSVLQAHSLCFSKLKLPHCAKKRQVE